MLDFKNFFSKEKKDAESRKKQINEIITGSLTSVVIPHSIEKIGKYSFAGNSLLKHISISDSITEIN